MMEVSKHYSADRREREEAIAKIGLGRVLHSVTLYDEKRGRKFTYEVTSTAVLIVKAVDRDLIITQYPARPSRIRRYWEDAPAEIIKISIEHTQAGLTF